MRLLGHVLVASTLASSFALAAEPALKATEVLARLVEKESDAQRKAWFDAHARGKSVAWTAPVFNVTTFGLVLVNTKVSDRGLIACHVPERLAQRARALKAGEPVLCVGRVEDYERLLGAALVNVKGEDVVIGAAAIAAWEKARQRSTR